MRIKLPIKMSAGLGLSMLDRAIKERFAQRCSAQALEQVRDYFVANGGLRCLYCGHETPDRWDHLHAVSRGGDTIPGNLVPACGSCDDSKQDRDVDEWFKSTSKRKPDQSEMPRVLDQIRAYQGHFDYTPREFEDKLTPDQLASYLRFRTEIAALRTHLESEGFLRKRR